MRLVQWTGFFHQLLQGLKCFFLCCLVRQYTPRIPFHNPLQELTLLSVYFVDNQIGYHPSLIETRLYLYVVIEMFSNKRQKLRVSGVDVLLTVAFYKEQGEYIYPLNVEGETYQTEHRTH